MDLTYRWCIWVSEIDDCRLPFMTEPHRTYPPLLGTNLYGPCVLLVLSFDQPPYVLVSNLRSLSVLLVVTNREPCVLLVVDISEPRYLLSTIIHDTRLPKAFDSIANY